jgi:cytoskeletal protein RodZ
MEIYVLRNGKEIGPFTEEKAHLLLTQGSIGSDDLAWSPGMAKWEPLTDLLPAQESGMEFAPEPLAQVPAPAPARAPSDSFPPATARQRALLAFLGISFTPTTSKMEAALMICDAMENPAYSVRFGQWQSDRLKLHPDLFAVEIQTKKDNRAHQYLQLTQTDGAEYFSNVTRTHAQALVSYLDSEFPNWDANESTAARTHFFPAIATKFPQLATQQWQDRFQSSRDSKGPSKPASTAFKKSAPQGPARAFPFGAIVRGFFFVLLLAAIAWFVMKVMQPGTPVPSAVASAGEKAPTPPAPAITSEPAPSTETPAPAPSPQASSPAEATPPAAGSMAAAPPASDPAPTVENSPAPPAPTPPIPTPAPGLSAGPPTPMTDLQLTKPFDVKLAYGLMKLPTGTVVKFLSQEGETLRVQYLNNTILVPAASTNIGTLSPAAAPLMNAAPAPAATAPLPDPLAPPKKESLF